MPIRPENKSRYPADWDQRSKFVRFYRAQGRCEWCGIKNGTPLPMHCCSDHAIMDADVRHCASCGKSVPRVVLTTAHVFKQEPEAADLLNLAAVIRAVNSANVWNVLEADQWGETYKVPAILALIHSEVSEALEAFRKDDCENFMEELADVLIRVLDCVGGFESDFDAVVRAKLDKNKQRAYRHGGKRV